MAPSSPVRTARGRSQVPGVRRSPTAATEPGFGHRAGTSGRSASRLTASAHGEDSPVSLPDGPLLSASWRPDPAVLPRNPRGTFVRVRPAVTLAVSKLCRRLQSPPGTGSVPDPGAMLLPGMGQWSWRQLLY